MILYRVHSDPLPALTDHRFVSLTTFRRWGRREGARAIIRRTYPVGSRVVLGLERIVERLRGRSRTPRPALRITGS